MAITLSRVKDAEDVWGKHRTVLYDITLDSSYPTGGEAITPREVGLSIIKGAQVMGIKDATSGGVVVQWDYDSQKLMAFRSAGFTPAGTNSKPSFTVEASGSIGSNMEVGLSADSNAATFEGGTGITAARTLTTTSPVGTPTFTGTAVAAASLVEVSAGVSLASVTVRVLFYGQ